jgi:DNA-binding NtrC family response regulator
VADRIVIIDAEPVVRATIAAIMKSDGYDVVLQTDDPKAVLEIVHSEPPALIITNVALPGISGHDAMQLFKQHSPEVPVLMITGLPDVDVIREWKSEPGFGIFPKPFRAADLKAKVREMISSTRAAGSGSDR